MLSETVEFSLPNGLQVVAVLSSATSEGVVLSVKRRPPQVKSFAELAQAGLLDDKQATALQEAVREKRQLWFVGPTGPELSRLMAGALAACPAEEGVALFERSPEIALGERAALCLKLGVVSMDVLLERARHFRPQRLVIHEPREDELAVVLTRLALRHDGSLVAFEHRSSKDTLSVF
mgnify:CR=1 FL=1